MHYKVQFNYENKSKWIKLNNEMTIGQYIIPTYVHTYISTYLLIKQYLLFIYEIVFIMNLNNSIIHFNVLNSTMHLFTRFFTPQEVNSQNMPYWCKGESANLIFYILQLCLENTKG
jgi:hypothetical protein